MSSRWGSFPSWWVRDNSVLPKMTATATKTGQHIAGLKVYLAMAAFADYETGIAVLSVTQLQEITGLSRPMVTKGIRELEDFGLLSVDRSGYRSVYQLVEKAGDTHWLKVPANTIQNKLRNLPNSGATALAALKLYVVLLTVRQRGSHEAQISHTKIQARTSIRPSLIAKGMSHLISHEVARFSNAPSFKDAAGHRTNVYYLIGTLSEKDLDDDKEAGVLDNAPAGSQGEKTLPSSTQGVIFPANQPPSGSDVAANQLAPWQRHNDDPPF